MLRNTKIAKTNSGFTLVEILVVIAITAVLFGLLLNPLVNSFRLTQRAQMLVAAQDQARIAVENLSRELGSAAYVFDNTTHPLPNKSPSTNAASPNLQFTNFLILDTPQQPSTGTVSVRTAVAFNAKLDFVMPRHNATGALIDPTTGNQITDPNSGTVLGTTGEPVTINPTTGALQPTGITFPLAPGTTMIRYWIGLRDPTKVYATHGEGPLLAANGDNTYILYRAQYSPTTPTGTKNSDGTTVDEDLFQPKTDPTTGSVTNTPEFDDPDFFRTVTTADINWLDPSHANYTATTMAQHNARVAKWQQIAKPVLSIPNVDLILLPHNSDNTIYYAPTGTTLGNLFPNTACSAAVHDPVSGTDFPVVNTSVTFHFGSVQADASAANAGTDASAGYGGAVAAANGGMPYIPTVYTATDQSWAFPYHVNLYQYDNTQYATYQTSVTNETAQIASNVEMYAGDLIESMYSNATGPGTAVYDVTTGQPLVSNGDYVPMTITPDTGTVNFDMPALPDPTNPFERFWSLPASDFVAGAAYGNGVIDLSQLANGTTITSPLQPLPSPNGTVNTAGPDAVANSRLVPGSVRVYGPDSGSGPNQGQTVLYTEVSPGSSDFGPNEYMVNYANNTLTLYLDPNGAGLPQPTTGPTTVQIAFDYQANMMPANPAYAMMPSNPVAPLRVRVDYQTRDLLDINMGVRVYDPNNVGPAQIVTVHNQVRIGNSNR